MSEIAAVVGHPITHSLSPAMHNDALSRRGSADTYGAHDVTEDQFAALLAQLRGTSIRGLSVTMPLKDVAFDLVDHRDEFAQRSRSVNTITFDTDGRMRGSDTDGRGCVDALRRFGCDITDARCMVLGAGGAARSIVVALDAAGAREVVVVNRTRETANEAAACARGGRVGSAEEALSCRVIVNATPVGMALAEGGDDATPLEASHIAHDAYVLDAVYTPLATRLLRDASDRGATAIDGLWMLVHQAVLQHGEWFGIRPDADAMRAAAEAELARR